MIIKIKRIDERSFMDVLYEIDTNVKFHIEKPGKKYVTYVLNKEWYETIHDFYKRLIEAFRVQ